MSAGPGHGQRSIDQGPLSWESASEKEVLTTTPVIAVVGYQDSGKTTVAAGLVRVLSDQGLRVAAVKHCPHGHEVDRQGSDTDRLGKAGAATVVAASPGKVTRTDRDDADPSLESIVASLSGFDIIIAEGFKGSNVPKILVAREGRPILIAPDAIAVVTDTDGDKVRAGPRFGFEDMEALAAYIGECLLTDRAYLA